MSVDDPTDGRVTVVLVRPRLSIHFGVRPTVVADGRGQPSQWGVGTWKHPGAGRELGVYLFNRAWRYGDAVVTVPPDAERVVYTAPRLPFGRGSLSVERR